MGPLEGEPGFEEAPPGSPVYNPSDAVTVVLGDDEVPLAPVDDVLDATLDPPDLLPPPDPIESGDYDDTGYDDTGYDDTGYDDWGYDDTGYDDSGTTTPATTTGAAAEATATPNTPNSTAGTTGSKSCCSPSSDPSSARSRRCTDLVLAAQQCGAHDGCMTTVRVAAVQAAPVFLDRDATVDKAGELIDKAAGEGAELVVLPESFVPTYPDWVWRTRPWDTQASALWERLVDQAVVVGSAATDALARPPAATRSTCRSASPSARSTAPASTTPRCCSAPTGHCCTATASSCPPVASGSCGARVTGRRCTRSTRAWAASAR